MRKIAGMAVLIASFLLLAGVSFADECYEITCTNLDTDFKFTHNVYIDPDYSPGFDGICGTGGGLILFYDSMKLQAIVYDSPVRGYLKFHGDYFNVVQGIVSCSGSDRWSIRGHMVDYGECQNGMTTMP